MTLEEILKKRTNVSFFKEDKIPDKKIIEEILDKAHNLTPHKNNFYMYNVEVYGPEHFEEKKYVALATVCSHAKHHYSDKFAKKEDFEQLEKIYDEWIEYHKTMKTREQFFEMRKKLNKIHFNNQVRAPYLLVYTKKEKMITDSQKESEYYKSGKVGDIFQLDKPNPTMWLIQAGMHSMVTSSLAVEKGLDVSFCKCFFYNTHIHSNILRKSSKNSNDIAFLLGIGYADKTKYQYKSWVDKPKIEEIIKWK